MKIVKRGFLLLLFILFVDHSLSAQSHFGLERKIEVSDLVEKEKIDLNIIKGTIELQLEIDCRIFKGKLDVIIFDPKGEEKGKFSVESHFDEKHRERRKIKYGPGSIEEVNGRIDKIFKSPMEGKWIILIDSDQAAGEILINTHEYRD